MTTENLTREEMWSRQQISSLDVDYDSWIQRRKSIEQIYQWNQSCFFIVDVLKGRYDLASPNFATLFGYNPDLLERIQKEGDLLEERIHPDDRDQLIDRQIQHSQFIYSLSPENRNDYSTIYQFRILNRKREYINIVSRQQVLQTDDKGKAWMIMGVIDISPDPYVTDIIKCSVLNLKTGEIIKPIQQGQPEKILTKREQEILELIRQGLLSKEIAHKLDVSIHTIHNHRKNILHKLNAHNVIEVINQAHHTGLFSTNAR